MNNKENIEPNGGGRQSSRSALLDEAKRLRLKADLLERLAGDVEGHLSEDGDKALWGLIMNSRKS